MTRPELILKIAKHFHLSIEEATDCVASYTDGEIAMGYEEIIHNIEEDYRDAVRERRYLDCGY